MHDAERRDLQAQYRGEWDVGYKQMVRAKAVIEFLSKDPGALKSHMSLVICQPGQRYLNKCMELSREWTKFYGMTEDQPRSSKKRPAEATPQRSLSSGGRSEN